MQFQLDLALIETEMNATVMQSEENEHKKKVLPLIVVKIIVEMLVNGTEPSAAEKILRQ